MADETPQPVRTGGAGANAAIVIAVIMVAAAIYLLQAILAPFLVAVFLLVVIGGLSRILRRLAPGTPRPIAMGLAVIIILGVLAVIAWITVDNITLLLADAETYAARLNDALVNLQHALGVSVPSRLENMLRSVDASRVAAVIGGWLQIALTSTGFMLIYLGFMMASGRTFSRKLLAITGARAGLEESQAIFERIREAVANYIWVQTATGLLIAAPSWLLLWAFAIPNPVFWAFVIFVTSYVPIVGGIVGVFLPVLFVLAITGNFGTALVLLACLQAIQIFIGNVLQPRMQSKSLNVDPVVVLLSLGIWGLLLGPAGAFLSTPLTVTAMMVLAQFPRTRWMAILLSDDARPGADRTPRDST